MSRRVTWLSWLGLAAAAVVLVGFRLHSFDLPLETDECNYAYIGARLLEGDRLYVDVWDHQPYGVFVLFAGLIAAFGDEPLVFRWAATVFSLISLLLIFAILWRTGGNAAAVAGAFLFAFASSDPGTAGEGVNREIFMNTLILAAWYLVLRAKWKQSSSGDTTALCMILAAGVALALASTLKTIVAVHWLVLSIWLVAASSHLRRHEGTERNYELQMTNDEMEHRQLRSNNYISSLRGSVASWLRGSSPIRQSTIDNRRSTKIVLTNLAFLAAGPALLWILSLAYFSATGRGGAFIEAVFLFNLDYVGTGEGFFQRFARFFSPPRHPFVFDSALPLWIGAAAAAIWLTVKVLIFRSLNALLILLLLVAGYVAVCLPGRFWPHYYYLLLPPAVLAVASGVGDLVHAVQHHMTARLRNVPGPTLSGVNFALRSAPYALHLFLPLALLLSEYQHYLRQPLFGITITRYNGRDFWGRAQGQNVRRVTEPGDAVFVYGNDVGIYYYSGRRSASRFTMLTGLQGDSPAAVQRRRTLIAELRENMPRVIVVLFMYPPFEQWKEFLEEHYEFAGMDLHERKGEPIMFVFARKDRPIQQINWDWDRASVGGWFLGE